MTSDVTANRQEARQLIQSALDKTAASSMESDAKTMVETVSRVGN